MWCFKWFLKLFSERYVLLSRCGRFQDVLMLECRIGLYDEQTKRACLNARRGEINILREGCQ